MRGVLDSRHELAALLALTIASQAQTTPKAPKFFARRDYLTGCDSCFFVYVGDVTGDGIPDIVNLSQKYVSVLQGHGNGTFHTAVTTTFLNWGIVGVALVDLNGDGKQDLIISGYGPDGGAIGVLLSNGDGAFQAPVLYTIDVNYFLYSPVVGDFNGDGIPDVVAADSKTGLWLFTGKGGGVFNPGVLAAPSTASGANWLAAPISIATVSSMWPWLCIPVAGSTCYSETATGLSRRQC